VKRIADMRIANALLLSQLSTAEHASFVFFT
jgi:hypothetical protein